MGRSVTSSAPIRDVSPHFPVYMSFDKVSCAECYNILCRKLVQERLYTAVLIINSECLGVNTGEYSELTNMTGLRTVVTELAGHAVVEVARS